MSPDKPADVNVFLAREHFWEGFGLTGCPVFDGKTVLEIGCGPGNRSIEAAAHGAVRVVGLDPSDVNFSVGLEILAKMPIAWRDRVTFFKGTLDTLPPEKFDVIISENSFEHVLNVAELLEEVRNRLNAGGRLYLGFGPLYHAPEGDHGWLREVLPGRRYFWWPWGHLLMEEFAFRKLSKLHGKAVAQTRNWLYLDLNQHTLAEYETMFRNSGLRMAYFKTNHVRSLKAHLFSAFGKIPGLSKYFTLNIFTILEKVN
jgi:SAM-dependent methyltransferase